MSSCGTLLSRDQLHGYQEVALTHALIQGRAGLFLSPGLGKTIIALTLIASCHDLDKHSWLVFCPLRVISTWLKEAKKWEHTLDLPISVIHGGDARTGVQAEANRREALEKDAAIYLINYEGASWLHSRFKKNKGLDVPFRHVVFDESQRVKDPSTSRWKHYVKPLLPVFDRRVLLSGTPCGGGGLEGLWSQHFILDQGQALGTAFEDYKYQYFHDVPHSEYRIELNDGADKRIWNAVKSRCISMRAADYLDLPPLTRNFIELDLPVKARAAYDELQKEFFLELDEHNAILPANAATAQGKLRQLIQGGVYDDEHDWHEFHTVKIDALADLIDELQGSPLLVLYQFDGELEMIRKRFGDVPVINGKTSAKQSSEMVDAWNRDEIPVLFAHPKTVSLGLNMQYSSGHNVCWLAATWSLEEFIQSEERVYRQGQRRGVVVHHITVTRSVDQVMSRALKAKEQTQEGLLSALRQYRRKNV